MNAVEHGSVLQVSSMAKTYGKGTDAKEVIAGIDLTVQSGEFVCIVGPSGAGKTTLLKCLSGLIPVSAGRVELKGRNVVGPPEGLALVFQDYGRSLLPWLSVRRNVELPLVGRAPKRSVSDRAARSIAEVGLSGAIDQYPWQLSGGMQQRVAIARALAYDAELLLMDEPFAAVDAQTRFELEDLMLNVQQDHGITVVFVTHDIDEAVYLGSRVVVLSGAPAIVSAEFAVDLPRPRNQVETRALPEFIRMRSEILARIQAAGGAHEEEPGKDMERNTADSRIGNA